MPENIVIRTEGGPHPGDRIFGIDQTGWPPPDTLEDEDGNYYKVSESDLPPQEANNHIIRSATYRWQPEEKEGDHNSTLEDG